MLILKNALNSEGNLCIDNFPENTTLAVFNHCFMLCVAYKPHIPECPYGHSYLAFKTICGDSTVLLHQSEKAKALLNRKISDLIPTHNVKDWKLESHPLQLHSFKYSFYHVNKFHERNVYTIQPKCSMNLGVSLDTPVELLKNTNQ